MRGVLVVLLACGSSPHDPPMNSHPDTCQIVESADELAGCVGQVVTLRGVVSRTKWPQILGVEVVGGEDLADRRAEATGRLETYTVEPFKPGEPIVQSNGPGTYYRLVDLGDGRATAKPR